MVRRALPWAAVAALVGGLAGCAALNARDLPQRSATLHVQYLLTSEGETSFLRVIVVVPKTIPGRQFVEAVEWQPEPLRVWDAGECRYAEFLFSDPQPTYTVELTARVVLAGYDLSHAMQRVARGAPRPAVPEDLRPYLVAEPGMQKDDPAIVEVAKGLTVAGDDIGTVRRAFDFVVEHMQSTGYDLESHGAVEALTEGTGDCTEYADLFVALVRAAGIPARHVSGYLANDAVDTPQHSWAEVYLKGMGWVPFDPVLCDGGQCTFDSLGPQHLSVSPLRNDELLDNQMFVVYRWWGDRVTLTETVDFR